MAQLYCLKLELNKEERKQSTLIYKYNPQGTLMGENLMLFLLWHVLVTKAYYFRGLSPIAYMHLLDYLFLS